MSDWISVEDRLPAIGDQVLIAFGNNVAHVYYDSKGFCSVSDYSVLEPTHWMPLPEPPIIHDKKTEALLAARAFIHDPDGVGYWMPCEKENALALIDAALEE